MRNLKKFLNSVENKTLVTIFPHPDDETLPTGGLLLEAKKLGYETIVICLTKGDAGKSAISLNEKLSKIREKEFTNAVKILNISGYYLLDFLDSKLREKTNEIEKELSSLLNQINPGVIVTYDYRGATGHPDHIALSLSVSKIINSVNSKPFLIWVSFSGIAKKFHSYSKTFKYFSKPNLRLNLTLPSRFRKVKAFLQHKSQISSFRMKISFIFYCLLIPEEYHEFDSKGNYAYEFVDFEI